MTLLIAMIFLTAERACVRYHAEKFRNDRKFAYVPASKYRRRLIVDECLEKLLV